MNIIPRSKDFTLYSNKENSQVRMYITQGEYATTLANFTLYDGSTALDLTNASQVLFSVYFTHNRNTATTLPVEITDADDGKISVATVANLSANYDGNGMDCFVQAIFPTKTVKFSGMKIYVKADPSLDVLAQTSDAHTLIDAINKLALIDGDTGTIEVDDALSTTSIKPVQNKKITQKINEMDTYLSGHSFIYDLWGRIYSYSNNSTITSNSFGEAITRTNGCYVWLGMNVTTVEDNSLPDPQYISQIRYEGKAEDLTIGEMYASKVTYGRSNRSVFYFLATLSYLFNNMVKASDVYSKTDSDNKYRLQTAPITENDLASALLALINGKVDSADVYTQTQADNTFEKVANKKQSISTDRQTTTAENAWYPSITAIKSFLFTNFYTQTEIDNLLAGILDGSDDESIISVLDNKLDNEDNVIKSRHISTGAVTETKLATALANKINGKIDTISAVKYVNDESIDNCIRSDTIYFVYTTSDDGVTGNHVILCTSATNQRTQYLFAQEGGIQYRKQVKSGGVFGDWGSWTKLATTATTTQLSDAITALNTAVESLQQNAIMKTQGAVIESYINGGAVTEAKLATELSNKINGKINSSEAIKYQYTTSLDNCTSQDTIYKYYGYDMQGFTGNHLVLCLTTANSKTTQVLFSSKGLIQYRTKEYQGEYSEWKEVATTSQTTALSTSLLALGQRVTDLENTRITKTQGAVIEDYINNGAVTKAKLAPALKSELDNKIDSEDGVLFVSAQNANNCLSQNTLYVLQTEVEGHLQNTHTMIVAEDIDNRAQYRFSVEGGFEYRIQTGLLQEGNPWSEWKSFAEASTVSNLTDNLSNNYYTMTQMDGLLLTINNAITNLNNTVELKTNKATDIDSSTSVGTAEETQYPTVGAIKRFTSNHLYRQSEIDTMIGGLKYEHETRFELPISVGFDSYKIPVNVIEGTTIAKSMVSNQNISILFISDNVTEVETDILDNQSIQTIYINKNFNEASELLADVVGLSNVNVYFKGDFNFSKFMARATAYIRSLIVGMNTHIQNAETNISKITNYTLTITLSHNSWVNSNGVYVQNVDISNKYTLTPNSLVTLKLNDTVLSQLDGYGCESISVDNVTTNDTTTLQFAIEGNPPTADVAVDILLTETVSIV